MRRKLLWIVATVALLAAVLVILIWYGGERLEPFMRDQTLSYLRQRYDGDVELGSFDVSMSVRSPWQMLFQEGRGAMIEVSVDNILVRHRSRRDIPPLLAMKGLQFRVDLGTLWEKPAHVEHLKLASLEVTIPPRGDRPKVANQQARPEEATDLSRRSPLAVFDLVDLDGMKLVILPKNPEREPLEFEMTTLKLESAGIGVPMRFTTVMRNAKPPGLIDCTGTFGPFVTEEPGESPLSGDYVFTQADLGVFDPIAGTLSSTGHFEGRLNEIIVDGETDTPDFRLKSAGNAVPLKTKFHAIVDGTSGDTWLRPVEATLGSSPLVIRGGVARNRDESKKTVDFDVKVENGRIEDFIRLAVKGEKPLLEGAAQMNFKMIVPPGPGKVINRLVLDGTFDLEGAAFTSPMVQEKIDELSRRTRGKPGADEIQSVPSDFQGAFELDESLLTLDRLLFAVPGADVSISGQYNLVSEVIDFRGVLRTQARLSQMVKSRWKRILLIPVDPFFAKDGAGAVIRIAITGTRDNPKFGRDK